MRWARFVAAIGEDLTIIGSGGAGFCSFTPPGNTIAKRQGCHAQASSQRDGCGIADRDLDGLSNDPTEDEHLCSSGRCSFGRRPFGRYASGRRSSDCLSSGRHTDAAEPVRRRRASGIRSTFAAAQRHLSACGVFARQFVGISQSQSAGDAVWGAALCPGTASRRRRGRRTLRTPGRKETVVEGVGVDIAPRTGKHRAHASSEVQPPGRAFI